VLFRSGSPAIGADGTVYIGSLDSKLYALNADGTFRWSYTTGNQVYGSPAIGADGTIYIGSYDNNLYALNPDGTLKWSYTTGGHILGSAAIGSDGTVYIGSYDNKLYALNPDGTQMELHHWKPDLRFSCDWIGWDVIHWKF
jgi:outer membrane protein assembly factor BamB